MTQNRRLRTLALALLLAVCCLPAVQAADLEAGAEYCFQSQDFQTPGLGNLTGACITGIPAETLGTVALGSRQIRPGDILTAAQLDRMTFASNGVGGDAQVTYLPIYGNRVEEEAVMTFSIRKKENKAPQAENISLETYKNLSNQGKLKACDPEGGELTFAIVQEPKRGDVTLEADGTFTYTPKKNKVGKDCFTYTATDAEGLVSNEATVTVEILKPTDSSVYRDMTTGQFEALWMKNTGLFSGTNVAGQECFGPQETVTRGDFLAMVMELFDIPAEDSLTSSGFADEADAPEWLMPYLAAAMRLGVVSGSRTEAGVVFRPNDPITEAEAATMLQNVLMLPTGEAAEDVPAWAQSAVSAVRAMGIALAEPDGLLTRAEASRLLYAASRQNEAPGLEVFRKN